MLDVGVNTSQNHNRTSAFICRCPSKIKTNTTEKQTIFSNFSSYFVPSEGIMEQVLGNSACANEMLIQYRVIGALFITTLSPGTSEAKHGQGNLQLKVNCHISLWLFKESLVTCNRRTNR